ncbi:MAG: hypothetical protein II559_04855 [Muribaculaceae bacterium]|nr:hypothetical protein [Muribaculaceae bacterium]
MKKTIIYLTLMLFVCEITFTSCKDKEEVVDDVVTESSEYVVYKDGVMLNWNFGPFPDPGYELNVPAQGATYRIDDVVNWMTGIELEPPLGLKSDFISITPFYVNDNDNGKERIDYFDITFQPNKTGSKRECSIRTLPFQAIKIGTELILVGTVFSAYQLSE